MIDTHGLSRIQQQSYKRHSGGMAAGWPPESAMSAAELEAFLESMAFCVFATAGRTAKALARPVAFVVVGTTLWIASSEGDPPAPPARDRVGFRRHHRRPGWEPTWRGDRRAGRGHGVSPFRARHQPQRETWRPRSLGGRMVLRGSSDPLFVSLAVLTPDTDLPPSQTVQIRS